MNAVLKIHEQLKELTIGRVPITFSDAIHFSAGEPAGSFWKVQTTIQISKNLSIAKLKRDGTKSAAMHQRAFDLSGRYFFVFHNLK